MKSKKREELKSLMYGIMDGYYDFPERKFERLIDEIVKEEK